MLKHQLENRDWGYKILLEKFGLMGGPGKTVIGCCWLSVRAGRQGSCAALPGLRQLVRGSQPGLYFPTPARSSAVHGSTLPRFASPGQLALLVPVEGGRSHRPAVVRGGGGQDGAEVHAGGV